MQLSGKLSRVTQTHNASISWDKLRLQLGGAILFGLVVPFLFSAIILRDFSLSHPAPLTLAAAGAAILTATSLYRSIGRYPGVTPGAYIVPCILIPFGIVALLLLIGRVNYGRVIFSTSLVLCAAWFHIVYFQQKRVRVLRIAIVPCGDVNSLWVTPGPQWYMITSPDTALDPIPNAVAADLRSDIPDEWDRKLADYVLEGIPVYDARLLRESLTGRVEINHISENTFGSLAPLAPYLKARAFADKVTAALVLVALLPLLLVVAIMVRLDSPGPALFRQIRIGYRGRRFEVVKFRTMRVAADTPADHRSSAITRHGDDRITRLGRFLRRSRIDELPQIINILRGEMSWIGPRPEAAALSAWYEKEIAFYRYRHVVPPGITGWAQVCLGHVAEIDEVRQKLAYDFYYIKHFSFWLDFLIVLQTIRTMLTGFGAR